MLAPAAALLALIAAPALAKPAGRQAPPAPPPGAPACPLDAVIFAPLDGPPGLALATGRHPSENRPLWTLAHGGERVPFGLVFQSGNGHLFLVEEREVEGSGEPVVVRAEILDGRLRTVNIPRALEEPGPRPVAYLVLVGLRDGLRARGRLAEALPVDGLWRVAACAAPGRAP
jgi:hypothetical protein